MPIPFFGDHRSIKIHIWLVVYLPLWTIWKSVGIIISNIWKTKSHVPNHQPDIHPYIIVCPCENPAPIIGLGNAAPLAPSIFHWIGVILIREGLAPRNLAVQIGIQGLCLEDPTYQLTSMSYVQIEREILCIIIIYIYIHRLYTIEHIHRTYNTQYRYHMNLWGWPSTTSFWRWVSRG